MANINIVEQFRELVREKEILEEQLFELREKIKEIKRDYVIANAIPKTKWQVEDDDCFRCSNIEIIHQTLNELQIDNYCGQLLHLEEDGHEFQIHLSARSPVYCMTGEFIKFLKKHGAEVRLDPAELKEKIQALEELIKAAETEQEGGGAK